MALDQLCTEIESRTQAQAAAMQKAAHDEARRIVDDAHSAAGRTLAAAKAEAEEFALAEGQARLTTCQLEASRHLVEAREEAVRQSLNQVWEYYRLTPKRAGYAAKLKSWAQKALDELGQPGAVLRANASDSEALRSAGFKVSKTALECAGGVRAETPDGRIAVDYTLESQFERKREDILHQIHLRLFSGEDSTMLEISPGGNGGSPSRVANKRGRPAAAKRLRSARRTLPAKFKARSKAVRSLSSSSMMSMPVSSRATARWRGQKR